MNNRIGLQSSPGYNRGGRGLAGLSIALILLLTIVLTWFQAKMPEAVPADAPETEFSSGRALKHVEQIAVEAHPVGTPGHQKVQDYIISQVKALGLTPEIQKTTVLFREMNSPFERVGVPENILVRLKGTGQGQALMLSAHYDSTAHSPAASKNGVGVSALLETMRALQAGPQLQNDVIFHFVDGTESFWEGSRAFVEQHPWAKDVKVAFNFETRGSSGPVYMFETTEDNSWLMKEFSQAVASPYSSSLLAVLYKQMPFSTDLTNYKTIPGVDGLNFAYIENAHHVRGEADTLERLDERTIQGDGQTMMQLARHFGNLDLAHEQTGSSTFFSLGNLAFVTYSNAWALPLAGVAALLFLGALVYGIRQQRITIGGVLLGFLSALLVLIAAAVVSFGVDTVIRAAFDAFKMDNHNLVFLFAFTMLALAVGTALYALLHRRLGWQNLAMGAGLLWFLAALATAALLPEGSYLFTWPLIFFTLGQLYLFRTEEGETTAAWLVPTLLTIPSLVLFVQVFQFLFKMLVMMLPPALVLLVALMFVLLLPSFSILFKPRRWAAPLAFAVLSAGIFVYGFSLPTHTAEDPKPNILKYGQNLDKKTAAYARFNTEDNDEFLTQYVPKDAKEGNFLDYLPDIEWKGPGLWQEAPAPVVSVPEPEVTVLEDRLDGDTRTLRLRVETPLPPEDVFIKMNSDQPIELAQVSGKTLTDRDGKETRREVIFMGPSEDGFEMNFKLKADQQLIFRTTYGHLGFPEDLDIERPSTMVANYSSNRSYITKTFKY